MAKTVRYQSTWRLCGYPLLAIAQGADLARQEARGHAKGVIAIGDMATGVLAVGGVARGVIAIGGVGVGLITIAGVGFGALVIGGVAFAQTAFGGVAIGHYAKGGVSIGSHVVSNKRVDHSAAVWFGRLGLHPGEDPQSSQPPLKNLAN